jgi:hypothetical protein
VLKNCLLGASEIIPLIGITTNLPFSLPCSVYSFKGSEWLGKSLILGAAQPIKNTTTTAATIDIGFRITLSFIDEFIKLFCRSDDFADAHRFFLKS